MSRKHWRPRDHDPARSASVVWDKPPEDMPLFAQAHARAEDPATSKRAAREVASRAKAQCDAVLAILRAGPIAGHELRTRCLESGIHNLTARISDLRGLGHKIEVKNHEYRLIS